MKTPTGILSVIALFLSLHETAAVDFRYPHIAKDRAVFPRARAIPRPSANRAFPSIEDLSSTSNSALTVITPSPGAEPITITSISQVVTSMTPMFTICEVGLTSYLIPGMKKNASTQTGPRDRRIEARTLALTPMSPTPSGAIGTIGPIASTAVATQPPPYPLRNTTLGGAVPFGDRTGGTIGYSQTESCTTEYVPTVTTVCHTTLTGIATLVTVTDCSQQVTFSCTNGYVMSIPTGVSNIATAYPQPTVQTLTTCYQARWQDFSSGAVPASVTERVCSVPPGYDATGPNAGQQCVDVHAVLQSTLVTFSTTSTTTIDLTTTIPGPSEIIIDTYHATVTDELQTVSISTRIVTEYQTETISTSTYYLDRTAKTAAPQAAVQQPGAAAAFATATADAASSVAEKDASRSISPPSNFEGLQEAEAQATSSTVTVYSAHTTRTTTETDDRASSSLPSSSPGQMMENTVVRDVLSSEPGTPASPISLSSALEGGSSLGPAASDSSSAERILSAATAEMNDFSSAASNIPSIRSSKWTVTRTTHKTSTIISTVTVYPTPLSTLGRDSSVAKGAAAESESISG